MIKVLKGKEADDDDRTYFDVEQHAANCTRTFIAHRPLRRNMIEEDYFPYPGNDPFLSRIKRAVDDASTVFLLYQEYADVSRDPDPAGRGSSAIDDFCRDAGRFSGDPLPFCRFSARRKVE
ncbi:hypothetical protein [Paenibacillus sp. MBLB4367]|uniref:hypothetical protein n=1 Tax=Paenibacillus sp. MBLB4367 TaxID=3384767 RepID=UPI003908121C